MLIRHICKPAVAIILVQFQGALMTSSSHDVIPEEIKATKKENHGRSVRAASCQTLPRFITVWHLKPSCHPEPTETIGVFSSSKRRSFRLMVIVS